MPDTSCQGDVQLVFSWFVLTDRRTWNRQMPLASRNVEDLVLSPELLAEVAETGCLRSLFPGAPLRTRASRVMLGNSASSLYPGDCPYQHMILPSMIQVEERRGLTKTLERASKGRNFLMSWCVFQLRRFFFRLCPRTPQRRVPRACRLRPQQPLPRVPKVWASASLQSRRSH